MLSILILAGGLATRLYPTTLSIPKSLIAINNVPFISFQLKLLQRRGISDVILCVGKFGDMIEDYVKDGSKWNLNVKYSYEDEDNLLGTGGAIKNSLNLLPDEFMITYGDSYLDINYSDAINKFYQEKKPMLITVYENKNIGDKSNIIYKNNTILKYDKKNRSSDMEHIDCGLLIVKKSIFKRYSNKFDLSQLMFDMVNKGKVSAYETHTPFYEIGSREGVEQFKNKQNSLYI